jgi:hypothetical protein
MLRKISVVLIIFQMEVAGAMNEWTSFVIVDWLHVKSVETCLSSERFEAPRQPLVAVHAHGRLEMEERGEFGARISASRLFVFPSK